MTSFDAKSPVLPFSRRNGVRMALAMLIAALVSMAMPLTAPSASAAPAASTSGTFVAQGNIALGSPTESALPLGAPKTIPVDLGAPAAYGSVLGQTVTPNVCSVNGADVCKAVGDAGGTVVKTVVSNTIGKALDGVLKDISNAFRETTVAMAHWLLVDELSNNNNGLQSVDLNASWFTGQYSLMRAIGLYLLIPMFMLAMIQAILRGSLYFVLRAGLIMLPLAILGSVVLVAFVSQLMSISDDFSTAIAVNTTNPADQASSISAGLARLGTTTMGLLLIVWCIFFIFAAVIVYVELLLRQTGIYLAAFFMPLAFSALVWPATVKWAKRLCELLIGLIFSKVFITAAICLGMAAVGHVGTPDNSNRPDDEGLSALAAGTMMLILGAFAGAKVLAISPGAMAAGENRVVNTAALWNKGQVVARTVQEISQRQAKNRENIAPNGTFTNAGAAGQPGQLPGGNPGRNALNRGGRGGRGGPPPPIP